MQASTAKFEAGKSPAITHRRGSNWPTFAVGFARGTSVCDDRAGETLPLSSLKNDPKDLSSSWGSVSWMLPREGYQQGAEMRIGVPKEVKAHEYRVGLVPGSVRELVHKGQEVVVETGAGDGIGLTDEAYRSAGASVASSAGEVFGSADMIVKVKEPQPEEVRLLRPGQVLFTYLHLAADRAQAEGLLRSGAICIAYETVTDAHGGLPLLAPMSEVAGRMSVQVGAHYLEKEQGGRGVLRDGGSSFRPSDVIAPPSQSTCVPEPSARKAFPPLEEGTMCYSKYSLSDASGGSVRLRPKKLKQSEPRRSKVCWLSPRSERKPVLPRHE